MFYGSSCAELLEDNCLSLTDLQKHLYIKNWSDNLYFFFPNSSLVALNSFAVIDLRINLYMDAKACQDYGLLQHRKKTGGFGWHESEVVAAGLKYKVSSPAYCYSHSEASFFQHMNHHHLQ